MRIAALIIGLFAGIVAFLQSCTLGGLSQLAAAEQMGREAGVGIVLAFLSVFGAAFALGKPKVATWLFGIGAVIGIGTGMSAEVFKDLLVWGVVLAAAAGASFLGQRERR